MGSDKFARPIGNGMAGDDTPKGGIGISGVNYFICNAGSNPNGIDSTQKHADDYSVLVTFHQTNL
ncbi:MAG: hypothetical protein ABSE48_12615 [Verrucomicrobiota bacterium]